MPDEKMAKKLDKLVKQIDAQSQAKPLNQARNRIDISFQDMLKYVEDFEQNVPTTGTGKNVKKLFATYHEMADRFYEQYQLSLLEEIAEQRNLQEQVKGIIAPLGRADSGDATEAVKLLKKMRDEANEEEQRLIQAFPTQLQKALDKLKDEWQHIHAIAGANQTLNQNPKLMEILTQIAHVCAFSIGIRNTDIVIVPGARFSLSFFAYLENFAVLSVPLYGVQAPFEWSIFWHELAGYKVRQLKDLSVREDIKETIRQFHAEFRRIDEKWQEPLLKIIARNNLFEEKTYASYNEALKNRKNVYTENFLRELFSQYELDLSDLGSFEYHFEQIMNTLLTEDMHLYEQVKAEGWCVDWFEELFEDAWSVVAIREPFLAYFEDILLRKGVSGDFRHPPINIRLSVAKEILKLMNPESETFYPQGVGQNEPETIEAIVAEQILKLISLLSTVAFLISDSMQSSEDTAQQQQKSEDISYSDPEMELALLILRVQQQLASLIEDCIGKSITQWLADTTQEARQSRDYFEAFYQQHQEYMKDITLNDPPSYSEPSYEQMLFGKDYKQLLELDFVELDFGFGRGDVLSSISFRGAVKFASITLSKVLPATLRTTQPSEISYTGPDGKTYFASKTNWNSFFRGTNFVVA